MYNIIQRDWFNIKDCYVVRKLCKEESSLNDCQLPNIHCCGGGSIITKHEEYWLNLENN